VAIRKSSVLMFQIKRTKKKGENAGDISILMEFKSTVVESLLGCIQNAVEPQFARLGRVCRGPATII